jgi:sialidase-1
LFELFMTRPWFPQKDVGSCLLVILLFVLPSATAAESTETPNFRQVFISGQDGYAAYRIPALLITQKGALLAFAEGRAHRRDHAENDIVLKRSNDRGNTWGILQVVAEDGSNALNNPTVVQVRRNGRVLLMYQKYAHGFDEHKAEPGLEGPRVCRTFLIQSDDEGATWSRAREVTSAVKRPSVATSTATGPGIGIQLRAGPHAGRILMPFNQGPYGRWKVYAAYSDDEGETWRYGETAADTAEGFANEVQFVELADGAVMLNARNQAGQKRRKVSFSRDGGETWTPLREEPALPEPACQASILRHPGRETPDVLLFCNPATPHARTNGTIRISRDEGKSWSPGRVLYPGSFAYSCLTSLPNGSVGCLFECDNYARITFAEFTVKWVDGP